MKKYILLLSLILGSIISSAQTWVPVGNTLQRSVDGTGFKYRFSLGSPGFYNITDSIRNALTFGNGLTKTGNNVTADLPYFNARFLQNNNTGTPQSASFNINGIGRFDSPTATTLFGPGIGSFSTEAGVTAINGGSVNVGTELLIPDISTSDSSSKAANTKYVKRLAGLNPKVFNIKSYGAVPDDNIDDTDAIQAAIDACHAVGGGTVFSPKGRYTINGPLKTSKGTAIGNAQLLIPCNDSSNPITITFLGESPSDYESQAIEDLPLATEGTIWESTLVTLDNNGFILQSSRPATGSNFTSWSYVTPILKNMSFRKKVFDGVDNVNNSLSGLDFSKTTKVILDYVKVDVNRTIRLMNNPTSTGSIGIKMPQIGNHALLLNTNSLVVGFDIGVFAGEHMTATNMEILGCNVGVWVPLGNHTISIQMSEIEACKINYFIAGNSRVDITSYNTEHYYGSEWFSFVKDFNIVSNVSGKLNILGTTVVLSNIGNSDEFIVTNSSEIAYPINRVSEDYKGKKITIVDSVGTVEPALLSIRNKKTNPASLDIGVHGTLDYAYIQSLIMGSTYNNVVAIQPNGGKVLVGTTTDNGEKLQVNGKATVSTAPTNSTDVVRKLELDNSAKWQGENIATSSKAVGDVVSYNGTNWINKPITALSPLSWDASTSTVYFGNTTGTGSTVVLNNAPTLNSPLVGTQTAGDNSGKAASTNYVDRALVDYVKAQGNTTATALNIGTAAGSPQDVNIVRGGVVMANFGNLGMATGFPVAFTNGGFKSTLQTAALTANRTVNIKDGDGTLAFLTDLNGKANLAGANIFTGGINSFGNDIVVDGIARSTQGFRNVILSSVFSELGNRTFSTYKIGQLSLNKANADGSSGTTYSTTISPPDGILANVSLTTPLVGGTLATVESTGTGWAVYSDNVYTSGSPFVVNSGVTSTLPNNAGSVINSQIPLGVTSFYNSGTSKIIPELNGDSYLINVRFTAVSSSNTGLADVSLDIGGAMGVIDGQTISMRKGAGNSQIINVIFDIYSLSTFVSNGGLIKFNSIDGNTSIYNIQYKITRTHKAK